MKKNPKTPSKEKSSSPLKEKPSPSKQKSPSPSKEKSKSQEQIPDLKLDDYSKEKINKPSELKDFDACSHFKENIVNYESNCKDPIQESSYYCLTCKKSICQDCGINEHKDHLLIQRENCLNYDKTFFNEISQVIEENLK